MKRLVWLGILLAGAAIWTVALFISHYFAVPDPEVNHILSAMAVGGPAAFLALMAHRLRLAKPLLLCLAAYCLGSAASTGLLHSLRASEAMPLGSSLEAFLVHAGSLTLFLPAEEGSYALWLPNILWLAVAGLVASIVLEAAARRPAARSTEEGAASAPHRGGDAPQPRRSLRPRRRRGAGNGTERRD